MRTIVIPDIHGMYDLFIELLKKVNLSKKDKLILLGDYVDRGEKSKKVIDKIVKLMEDYDVVALKGNHDDWFLRFLEGELSEDEILTWLHFGGFDTVSSYGGVLVESTKDLIEWREYVKTNYREHLEFLKGLRLYYEDEYFYYVHAGVNPFIKDIKNNREEDFYWMNRKIFLNNRLSLDKPVIFGHTRVNTIHGDISPYIREDKIGIDGGAFCSGGRLYAMIIERGKYTFEFINNYTWLERWYE